MVQPVAAALIVNLNKRRLCNYYASLLELFSHSFAKKSLFLEPKSSVHISKRSGLGGLVVAGWPLVHKFAGSKPTEAVGFFRAKKSSARLPSEGK